MTTAITGKKTCILRTDENYDANGITGLERVGIVIEKKSTADLLSSN
jgi:hypothetical protein